MKTDFKPNLSLTQKSRISAQYSHTGIWQRTPSALPGDE